MMRRSAGALILFALSLAAGSARAAAWVEMTPRGPEVRIVTTAPTCPPLSVGGRTVATSQRAGPTETFANRVCSAPLPRGGRPITVEGQILPTAKARPMRIVVIGDTGCRLKGIVAQHCNDPPDGRSRASRNSRRRRTRTS